MSEGENGQGNCLYLTAFFTESLIITPSIKMIASYVSGTVLNPFIHMTRSRGKYS